MRRVSTLSFAIFCVILLVFGCRKGREPGKNVEVDEVKPSKKTEPSGDEHKVAEKKEKGDPRQALLQKEYETYADVLLSHSAAELTKDEKKMLSSLLTASKLIEELYMLEIHPENLKWRKRIQQSGTEVEKKIFMRYQMPWCRDNDSPDCSALTDGPKKAIGHGQWPKDFIDEEYEGLTKQINGRELLSPFTLVRRKEGGGFVAIPYAKSELFGPKMKEVASTLRETTKAAPHKSLKKFLLSRADALESDSAYPYDESDYDWIALKGDWEVTVGPYEVYRDPRQIKAMFQMYIGREDKELTADLARFKENLQDMEDALGKLVGADIYKSRKLDPRIALRAVEIWMASGEGRKDRGATVAFHLPNRGKSVDEGLYKKVIMVNHAKAFEPVSKARAEHILDRDQLKYLDGRSDITNVTFHEFSHGFGAYHEMKVRNLKGKMTTVKQALKEYETLLEEAKADTLGLWLIQFQKSNGWIDEEQQMKRYVSGLMHTLGLFQYPLAGIYPRMVAIQLGWYLDAGGVIWNADEGRFKIDFLKIPGAIESLTKKVATIQLTADYAQAKGLIEKYLTQKDDKTYEAKGVLGEARDVMIDKFKKAGIRSPSLRYEITGL